MSSATLCPKCGGTIGTSVPGKIACACKRPGGSVATIDAPTKRCVTCGKDVTSEKRMKDSITGKYWCYDCGVKQPGAQTKAILCPGCKKPMSTHSMYRLNDQYVCQQCHESKTAPKKKGDASGGGKTLILVLLAVAAVAGVSAYLNDWLPI